MSSCFGFRRSSDHREPLLPQYNDDTTLQRELHQKLHSYQMVRALGNGYMPSNEQAIINLRSLLSSDVLNPQPSDLSDAGSLLVSYSRKWLQAVIDLLHDKNGEDQIQDFLWYLSNSRVSVDIDDLAERAARVQSKANTAAAFKSLQTVGSLLLTNSDFRLFLGDVSAATRGVFKDAATSLSGVAEDAAQAVDTKQSNAPPSTDDLANDVADVSKVVAAGASTVAKDTEASVEDKLSGEEGRAMMDRLKQTVVNLRKRRDYSQSVSTLSLLIKRYAKVYSRAAQDTLDAVQDDVNENAELDRATKNLWILVSSFGDKAEWQKLEDAFHKVLSHRESDPQFENLMFDVGDSLQAMLTQPDFFDHAGEKLDELRAKTKTENSTLRADVEALLGQAQVTLQSVYNDERVNRLIQLSFQVIRILTTSQVDLFHDAVNVFIPLFISAIQYLPVPRLEVSTPDIDLLLENLIIEPGKTVNHTSFLPYKLRVETYNDLEIRKAKFRTTSTSSHLVTVKIDGLSARADEVGFWLRAHSGIFRLADEGIASFALDERGLDIHLDIEIAKERMESMLSLKDVRVKIHKLDYSMRKSKFSWLAWLVKPVLQPIVRKIMEKQLASAIGDAIHAANRELLYARERLRATRIADPDDLMTFFRAIAARLTPEEDPDLYTRVGVEQPGQGVFKGVYAPGSVVKLWNEEAVDARERIEEGGMMRGWRNEIFDLHVQSMA